MAHPETLHVPGISKLLYKLYTGRKTIPVCTARGVPQQYLLPMGRSWGVTDAGHNIIKPLHFSANVLELNYQKKKKKKKMQPV